MTKLSQHFTEAEFACKGDDRCGNTCVIHTDLLDALEVLRVDSMAPLFITSGFRCKTHNKNIGGAKNSYHCKGMAADIYSNQVSVEQLSLMAEQIPAINGIGIYDGWLHIDVRKGDRINW